MKQEQFVARYQQEWQDLEHWLLLRAGASRRTRRKASALALDDTAFPQRYRRLCQQLALARERGYSPQLVQRLQQLMQQGHSVLYRTPPTRWRCCCALPCRWPPRQCMRRTRRRPQNRRTMPERTRTARRNRPLRRTIRPMHRP